MRLIDADALREDMQWCIDHDMYDKPYDYLAEIDDAPTIDAVQVVRCKNCKHWSEWENGCGSCHRSENGYNWFGVDATDYCSFGERRGEDDV